MSGDIGGYATVLSGNATVTTGLTIGNGTASSMTQCYSCNVWHWGTHHCCHGGAIGCGHVYSTEHEHDYQQATGPHEDTLYCRKCGETKRLRQRKAVA